MAEENLFGVENLLICRNNFIFFQNLENCTPSQNESSEYEKLEMGSCLHYGWEFGLCLPFRILLFLALGQSTEAQVYSETSFLGIFPQDSGMTPTSSLTDTLRIPYDINHYLSTLVHFLFIRMNF